MKEKLNTFVYECKLILNAVPTLVFTLFVLSLCCMNLLANKSILLPVDWLALDCGILVSWLTFLIMNLIATHFGPKASTLLSVLASLLNLLLCAVFFLGSALPGMWGEAYIDEGSFLVNQALNHTFGGTWYVLLGSTAAFLVSAVVNNTLNFTIGTLFHRNPDGLPAYIARTYLATAVGQFTDNLVFALLVSHTFFGWSLLQCVTCALTGMVVEFLCQGIFALFGYRVCVKWKRERVGEAYLQYRLAMEKN